MPDAADTDRKLVAAYLQRRDQDSFRELYRRHARRLYGLAFRLARAQEPAGEIVQETWVRALCALPDFRWESELGTWLGGIAIRVWREQCRAQPRETDAAQVIEMRPAAADSAIDLERAFDQLPPGFREVLLLHDVAGYTHAEVAGFLGIEEGTSKSQLSRARKAMREALRGGGENVRGTG